MVEHGDYSYESGYKEAVLLLRRGRPDVIVCANDDMALGAMQVAQEQGLKVAIIGFDALPEALAAVRDGKLIATIEQMPGGQSRMAMKAMVDYLRSGLPRDAYARARVNRSGRRYASVHVEAWQDNRSRLFAQATGHFLMPVRGG